MQSIAESPSRSRFLAVTVGAVTGLVGAGWALATAFLHTTRTLLKPGRGSVDELVTAVSSAAALLLLLWVCLGLLVSVLGVLPGRVGGRARLLAARIAPGAVRRWAGLLLGVTIASTLLPGGAAATPLPHSVAVTSTALESVPPELLAAAPTPGWVTDPAPAPAPSPAPAPEWAVPEQPTSPAPVSTWTPTPVRELPPVSLTSARPAAEEDREVIVRRGDTLWDLAAAYLGPDATDAEIATEWQRWYAHNRSVIGDDPDLLLPGQVLIRPNGESVVSGLGETP